MIKVAFSHEAKACQTVSKASLPAKARASSGRALATSSSETPKRSARLASITGFFSRRAAAMDSPSVSVVWQHDAVIVRSPVWFPFIPIPTALRLFETPRKR